MANLQIGWSNWKLSRKLPHASRQPRLKRIDARTGCMHTGAFREIFFEICIISATKPKFVVPNFQLSFFFEQPNILQKCVAHRR